MGEEAIGRRLLLFETPQFNTSPEQMLNLLTRILADRDLAATFFDCSSLADSEILGGAARAAIVRETGKRGMRHVLPSLAPVDTQEWPWQTKPSGQQSPQTLIDVVKHLQQGKGKE